MKERGKHVLSLSKRIISSLKPYSKKIQVAGSLRRKEKNPGDIDIVLIPKNKEKIIKMMSKKGKHILGEDKKAYFRIEGIKVELYFTNPEEWGAALLAYSSRRGSGIGLRIVARLKGFKLNQHGLFNRKTGRRVAGRTEEEI
ncbi:DNA polymerase III, partial [Candidatus Pacearchaeota archaeon]|nr:DNA polymerase III [Candidatus Pacearchaeota archaeon]